ncbi:MAG TPA: GNAT family N-acetyltransferase [Candidatus Bathyarchaeia archaeon]|nr:GNAT family N-acetyltransferase [Candidatus Bathyarchaeia archaeon]
MFVFLTEARIKSSSDKIVVRRIRTCDFVRLAEILNTAFQREIAIVGLETNRLMDFRKYHTFVEVLYPIFDFFHRDYSTILVASLKDKVVGEVHVVPLGKRIWTIDSLAADPNRSGKGVGFSLIKGSVEYIAKKGGKRALSSIRTDNMPALKIAQKLGFQPYQKSTMLFHSVKASSSTVGTSKDGSIRKLKSTDAHKVFEICKASNPTRVYERELQPKDFEIHLLNSPSEWMQNRLTQVNSEKLVVESKGEIVAYAHLTYTSPNEAARIDPLCISLSSDVPKIVDMLLRHTADFLSDKGITTLITTVNDECQEMIKVLEQKGFRKVASFHEIVKNLY